MVKACKVKMSGVKMSEVKVRYGKNKNQGTVLKRLYPDIFAVLTCGPFMTQAVLREIRPPSV